MPFVFDIKEGTGCILPLFYTTLQGVIFGDGEHTANKKNTKLIILYKTYQQSSLPT